MSRIVIPGARTASAQRRATLPPWLKGRAALYFDATDDLATGTIPADLTADSPFSILCRIMPLIKITATDRGAVSFGTVAANQAAFLGQVVVGGRAFIGGGLIGNTLADTMPAQTDEWVPAMLRYAGGAAGAMTLVAKDRSASTVATANIAGVVAELGRIRAAGTCLGGCVSDARILSRAVSDREYDAWRDGLAEPVTPRRFWSCENPGYGATCHEEIGGTEDAITGALWSPVVPFRRRRVVEDVAAAFKGDGAVIISVPDDVAFKPGVGDFAVMGWLHWTGATATDRVIAGKGDTAGAGWRLYRNNSAGAQRLLFLQSDPASAVSYVYTDTMSVQVGRDIHYAAVRTANSLRIYLDALRPSVVAVAPVNVDNAEPYTIGSVTGMAASLGNLNDQVYLGRAPTWDEIEAHCFNGVVPAGGISWGMREGAGVTAASIPAGYNGTLSAASWTTSTRSKARAAA